MGKNNVVCGVFLSALPVASLFATVVGGSPSAPMSAADKHSWSDSEVGPGETGYSGDGVGVTNQGSSGSIQIKYCAGVVDSDHRPHCWIRFRANTKGTVSGVDKDGKFPDEVDLDGNNDTTVNGNDSDIDFDKDGAAGKLTVNGNGNDIDLNKTGSSITSNGQNNVHN